MYTDPRSPDFGKTVGPTDFENCVPCPVSRQDIWRDTHLYRALKVLDSLTLSQVFSAVIALSVIAY